MSLKTWAVSKGYPGHRSFGSAARLFLCAALAVGWVGTARGFAECVDNDGDGYGSANLDDCTNPGLLDCDDGNGDIHPGATEVCNGVDDDCDNEIDEGLVLEPDGTIPVFGFETRGECVDTNDPCDLRDPGAAPEGCVCMAATHNFNQVIQACVDAGVITGPCDAGDPDAEGSLAVGDACDTGGTCQPVAVGLGEPCIKGLGVCRRLGTVVCEADLVVCDAVLGPKEVETEGLGPEPQNDPLCFDSLDNDCDGDVDHGDTECQTAELCDGIDNDNDGSIDEDFPTLGEDCTVGLVGSPCENTGVFVCTGDGAVACSLNANPPAENPEVSCGDGVDNDCDGLTDCADADCNQPESCDGVDNDCDTLVDEDFPTLGEACSAGTGACFAAGAVVCNADQTGTTCSAVALASSPERRTSGDSCSDGIDNDCDGLTDDEEADCQVSTLTVECSLIYDGPPDKRKSTDEDGRGEPGADCGGWHIPNWRTAGAVGDVTCSAEYKGLDTDGSILGVLPVQRREESHLVSRIDPLDFKMVSRTNKGRGTWHTVFAPIPLLEVTCRDDATTAKAFCSNVPYLDVIKPNGSVVSGSAGDEVSVLAAMPRVDPRTIQVLIDCVDIIPQLVADPATQLPGGPFSGTVDINGKFMDIVDLIIDTPDPDTESSVEHSASNTLTMTVVGAGCGGHAILVDGEGAADFIPPPLTQLTPECHVDDAKDSAEWSVFDITVTSPTEGEIIDDGGKRPSSINVTGEVCHGQEIDEVLINGFLATLPEPTIVGGGGEECAGDSQTVTVSFDENVPVTDVAAVFAGTQSTRGSFDPGPNKLIAQATDTVGNTTHDLVPFVVGPAIGTPQAFNAALQGSVAAGTLSIPKAFTLILDDTVTLDDTGNRAFREFFDTMMQEFSLNIANCLLQPRETCCSKKLPMPWWTCDPNVTICTTPQITQTPEEFADTFDIQVIPHEGFVTIAARIPALDMVIGAHGECCWPECGFWCISRTSVGFDGTMSIPDIGFEIDISEANILQQDGTFTLRFIPGDDDNIGISGNTESAISTGCSLLSIGTLFDILSGGLTAIPRLVFNLFSSIFGFIAEQHGIDLCPFVKEIGGKDGMQEESDDVTLCAEEENLDDGFGLSLEHTIDAVEITPTGLAIAMGVSIAPTIVDPQAGPITGTMSTEAPLVQPGLPETADLRSLSVAIADDFWNQLLAGMVQSGKLRANFTKVLKLSEYIPSCDEITNERRRARCVGMTECGPEDFETVPVLGEVCTVCTDLFPYRTCGGGSGGQSCTIDANCPGTCDGICDGGLHAGEACNTNAFCGLFTCVKTCTGGPTPGAACTLNTQCRDECIGCASGDDATCAQGACNRAARRARDTAINRNTDIVLHARVENPPAFYLDDDPSTELVEIIFRTGELRAALIANRDGNNDVAGLSLGEDTCDESEPCSPQNKCDQGDLDQLDLDNAISDCSLDSLPANVDCLLWSTCLDLDIKFAIGVTNVDVDGEMKPELSFELIGIVEPPEGTVAEDQGDQCGGSIEIPDLDFLNTESMQNDARRGIERSFCESTPNFQACALDFDGTIEFLNPALLTISNCTDTDVCDTNFADYLVITGDLRAKGLGAALATKVCENLAAKVTENTGECASGDGGGDEEREKLCD